MSNIDRRAFLVTAGAATAGLASGASTTRSGGSSKFPGDDHRGPCVIASGNGPAAVTLAYRLMSDGLDPVDAVVEGVSLAEADPNDMTVGYGGLPNEMGVVQLDASVMHGPTHKAGAVAALEDTMEAAKTALFVLRKTDHVLIVGQGATEFARSIGFEQRFMLTDRARDAWLKWRQNRAPKDDWIDDSESDWNPDGTRRSAADIWTDSRGILRTYGTINCSAVNADGDLSSVTTTSGLSYKIPGRVGDSPIIGAGMFVDNEIGAAGATGRGEAVIQNCGAFSVVQEMSRGLSPTEACLAVMKKIADNTKQRRLLDDKKRPNYSVTLYAVRKDGAYGSACMWPGGSYAVANASSPAPNGSIPSEPLFRRDD